MVMIWLLIARSQILSNRFLYLLNATGASNIYRIEMEGITGDIVERLARANILL